MKDKINESRKEIQGLLVTGFKLFTIVAPITGAIYLGLPELTRSDIVALSLLVTGLGMGIFHLNK